MTRSTNARLAGAAYLLYMAAGISNEILMHQAKNAEGIAAKLARIAEHATEVRVGILLALVECFSALVLAVTLYGITRHEDHELATLAMICRVVESVMNAGGIPDNLGLLWLARAGAGAPDAGTTAGAPDAGT